jgi:hypothetical protein
MHRPYPCPNCKKQQSVKGYCSSACKNQHQQMNAFSHAFNQDTPSSNNPASLSRHSTFHAAGSSSSSHPNYSSGAPPAAAPPSIPPQNPEQRHRSRPAQQRPVPPPPPPQASSSTHHQSSQADQNPTPSTDEKKYPCPQCGRRFEQPSYVKRHVKAVHDKEKPFECPHSGCYYKAAHKGTLTKHITTVHENKRPFSCQICGISFSKENRLHDHMVVHTPRENATHHCKYCSTSYAKEHLLRNHLRQIHGLGSRTTNQPPANQRESSGSRDRPPPAPPRPSL